MTVNRRSPKILTTTLGVVIALTTVGATFAQTPSPSPVPAASPSAAAPKPDRALRVHRGIVICDGAPFSSWPDHNTIPSGSTYPPARLGDSLEVIGDGTLADNGTTLYETTIDVVAPYGFGKHYYISAGCVNAG